MLPKRIKRKTIYTSKWINLHVDKVEMPSGKIIEKYHQLDYPYESIGVVLVNPMNEICLIKSLRYSTQKIEWEIPAGGINEGENIIDASAREVLEETGFTASNLKHVYSYNPSNGMSNENVHIVFARAENSGAVSFDSDEVESLHWLPIHEVRSMLKNKLIADGISVIGLLIFLSDMFE